MAQVALGWRWFWVAKYATYATRKREKQKNAKYNATYATYATQSPEGLDFPTFFGWRSGWRNIEKNKKYATWVA